MSNRLLALLILIILLWGVVWIYFYFFVIYGSNVILNGNVTGYSVNFSTEKLSNPIAYTCEVNPCRLQNIAPFDYTITISKEWYDVYRFNQKIQKSGEQTIDFSLVEKIDLAQLEEIEVSEAETILDKRERLKYNKYFLSYDFWENGIFYMEQYLWKLFLYRDRGESQILIYSFPLVSPDKIHIWEIYGTRYFTIYIDGKNYLFHNLDQSFRQLDLNVKIEYGKPWKNNYELIFATNSWAYTHNLKTKKSQYYNLFSDYLYDGDNTIIGIIQETEKNKLKNIGYASQEGNYVFSYDIATKTYKKLYTTVDDIQQIYLLGDKLILKIWEMDLELKNYKK